MSFDASPFVCVLHLPTACLWHPLRRGPSLFTHPLSGLWWALRTVCGAMCDLLMSPMPRDALSTFQNPRTKGLANIGSKVTLQPLFLADVTFYMWMASLSVCPSLSLSPKSLWGERLWGFLCFCLLYIKTARAQTKRGLMLVSEHLHDLLSSICKFYFKRNKEGKKRNEVSLIFHRLMTCILVFV